LWGRCLKLRYNSSFSVHIAKQPLGFLIFVTFFKIHTDLPVFMLNYFYFASV
jgi:hypothetical protein